MDLVHNINKGYFVTCMHCNDWKPHEKKSPRALVRNAHGWTVPAKPNTAQNVSDFTFHLTHSQSSSSSSSSVNGPIVRMHNTAAVCAISRTFDTNGDWWGCAHCSSATTGWHQIDKKWTEYGDEIGARLGLLRLTRWQMHPIGIIFPIP